MGAGTQGRYRKVAKTRPKPHALLGASDWGVFKIPDGGGWRQTFEPASPPRHVIDTREKTRGFQKNRRCAGPILRRSAGGVLRSAEGNRVVRTIASGSFADDHLDVALRPAKEAHSL